MDSETLSEYLGYEVKLRLTSGKVLEGVLWNYDKATETVILQSPSDSGTPGSSTVRLLKTPYLKEIVSAVAPSTPFNKDLPSIDMERLQKREAKLIQRMEEQIQSIGEGVSDEAQQIYDALVKTMPCKWAGKSIEVFQEVLIAPPYTPAAATPCGGNGSPVVLDRVKVVLAEERKRLGLV